MSSETITQPESPTAHVNSLIEITEALNEIFGKENTMLQEKRPRDMAPLQVEKARLAAAYAQSIRDVAANRALVQGADNRLLADLREITKSFESRAATQRALLNGARAASEGVVRAIADEATAQTGTPAYDPQSRTGKRAEKSKINGATPISFDESA